MAHDLQLRLTLTHLVVTFVGMLVVGGVFTALLANRITAAHESDLRREASALATELDRSLASGASPRQVQRLIRRDSELLNKRIILLDRRGHIRYDSERWTPFARGSWHLVDLSAALTGKGTQIEGGGRLGFQLPIESGGHTVGAVALVVVPSDTGVAWGHIIPALLLLFGLLGLIWLAVGVYFARSVSRPLRQVAEALVRARDGLYDRALPEEGWSDARMLASRYNEMVAQVARSRQLQRDFMVNAAHELKTPIALVNGFARSLADGTAQRGGALVDAVSYIKDESEHLSKLVEGLFALAGLEADPEGLVLSPCRPEAILRGVMDRFRGRAAAEGKTMILVPPSDLPACDWDADWIASALFNLVGNALDHTTSGCTIELSARAQDDQMVLIVADSGRGISPDDLGHIFERFFRGHAEKRADGHAGLGLALVREVAERHGGHVEVRSDVGEGARFSLYLPVTCSPRNRSAQEVTA